MRWILVLALLGGCDKKRESHEAPSAPTAPTETKKPAETDGAAAHPVAGLATTVPTGGPFELKVRELGASDPATLEQAKERLKHTIKDVIQEENTSEGYILTFSMTKVEMKEDADGRVHRDESGVEYAVQVRLAIDGKPTKCSAIIEKRDDVQAAVDACKALAKKS